MLRVRGQPCMYVYLLEYFILFIDLHSIFKGTLVFLTRIFTDTNRPRKLLRIKRTLRGIAPRPLKTETRHGNRRSMN